MQFAGFLAESEKFEIQAYKKPKDLKSLRKTHVSYMGSPQKHPYDEEKIILVSDPFSTNTFYYEFRSDDVSFMEKLPNLVDLDGQTVLMARIWVKKMSIGIRSVPFIVEDTTVS